MMKLLASESEMKIENIFEEKRRREEASIEY